MEDRISFNWKDLFVKVLFLVVFFLILLWLYPNNNLTTFYDKVYNANIQTMKVAARSHYTIDRLPKSGNSKRMTLSEMEEEKLVLPFLDKDGKRCNTEESYVEVTKLSSKEYALKVSLTCGNQTDYIMDTIGTYSECGGESCDVETPKTKVDDKKDSTSSQIDNNINNQNQTDDNITGDKDLDDNEQIGDKDLEDGQCTATEYEYKRSKQEKNYEECPTGFIQTGKYCTKSVVESIGPATVVPGKTKKVVTEAKVNPGTGYKVYAEPIIDTKYICGSEYDNAGTYDKPTKCIVTATASAPAERKDTYTCSEKYSNPGTYTTYTKCYGSNQKSDPAVLRSKFICGSEYDNAGTYSAPVACKKTTTEEKEAISKTTYTCSTAYDNAGTYTTNTLCYKINRVTEPAKLISQTKTYTCSTAYDNPGTYKVPTNCLKTTEETAISPRTATTTSYTDYDEPYKKTIPGYYTNWNCGTCAVRKYTTSKVSTNTTKYDPRGSATEYICSNTNCPGYVKVFYYVVYTRSWVAPKTTYTCSSAYNNAGTYNYYVQCSRTVTTTKYSYTCSSYYDNDGTYNTQTTCRKKVTTKTPALEKIQNVYKCDSTFINAGTYDKPTTCYKDVKLTDPSVSKTTYTCSSYYDNAGTYNEPTTCKKVKVQDFRPVKEDSYICSNKYQNAGTYNIPTNCIYSSDFIDEPIKDTKYVCNNTYDNRGTYNEPVLCIRKGSASTDAYESQNRTCPTGYIQSGTLCYKKLKNDDTYYCTDANAKLVGKTCVKTTTGSSRLECPAGTIMSHGNCYKHTSTMFERAEKECKETTEFIWSPTETLPGWERTGETRKTNVRCPEVTDCTKPSVEGTTITCPTKTEEDFFGEK